MISTSKLNIGDDIIVSSSCRNTAELLESRLEFLEGKEKEIMTMRIRQGATLRQIAIITGMHEVAVARLVRRLRNSMLRGAFAECLKRQDLLTREQINIAADKYLARLPLTKIAKKRECTLYHVRLVLSQLAALSPEGAKERIAGGVSRRNDSLKNCEPRRGERGSHDFHS